MATMQAVMLTKKGGPEVLGPWSCPYPPLVPADGLCPRLNSNVGANKHSPVFKMQECPSQSFGGIRWPLL